MSAEEQGTAPGAEPASPLGRAVQALLAIPGCLERITVPASTVIVKEGDTSRDMYFVVDGTAQLTRKGVDLGPLGRGDHFGELALLAGRPRAASVTARTELTLLRLSREQFEQTLPQHRAAAFGFIEDLVAVLGRELTEMTDRVSLLLRERSLPRRTQVRLRMGGTVHFVRTATPLRDILPDSFGDRPVVAALLDRKPVSLNTRVSSDATVEPLTTAHWEGRKVYRASVGLLMLEAARALDPAVRLQLGASVGFGQLAHVENGNGHDLSAFGGALTAKMRELAATGAVFREEWWTVEEAASHFRERGWTGAAELLGTWRHDAVPLVSPGEVYALATTPMVPHVGVLSGFDVTARGRCLLLRFGIEDYQGAPGVELARADEPRAPERSDERTMASEHERWLRALGLTSVGAFNQACVSGKVAELIHVSEGFHEKRVSTIADEIAARGPGLRVISIAGPSSSGKTTFIQRLIVQLRIQGLRPLALSLDDYYLDREKTPRDEKGEYDFEALEALDVALLSDHLRKLLDGATVRTARFDFLSGKSLPEGGPELTMTPDSVLLLEGIHGLNPLLWSSVIERKELFGVFIEPVTSLPFDRLTRVSVADLRLLRRIVRDRFQRGASAADNILRWPSVRFGERKHIFPLEREADAVYDTSLVYEPAVLKVYAERYLLEVPRDHPAFTTAHRLRALVDRFVAIYPDHVPSTSILREFIGGSAWAR